MTYTCKRCGKVFTDKQEHRRHEGKCGLGYTPRNCIKCGGTGHDVYGCTCDRCKGTTYEIS